jgi:hypothetical protein
VINGVSSGDGHDLVMDFDQGVGKDYLQFNGISSAEMFNQYFTWTSDTDRNGDGVNDTYITFKDSNEWSVTLMGVSDFDSATDVIYSPAA